MRPIISISSALGSLVNANDGSFEIFIFFSIYFAYSQYSL